MKVSNMPAHCAIIKQHEKTCLKYTKHQYMMVSSINALCVIIKLQDQVIFTYTKNLLMMVSSIPAFNVINSFLIVVVLEDIEKQCMKV